jgi:hypothetical protein
MGGYYRTGQFIRLATNMSGLAILRLWSDAPA